MAVNQIKAVNVWWARLVQVTTYGQVNHFSMKAANYVDSAFYPLWDGKMSTVSAFGLIA